MSVVANESVALECRSHAVPPAVLSWRKDGQPLEPRPGVRLSADKTLLEVCSLGGPPPVAELSPGWAGPVGAPAGISSAQCALQDPPVPTIGHVLQTCSELSSRGLPQGPPGS